MDHPRASPSSSPGPGTPPTKSTGVIRKECHTLEDLQPTVGLRNDGRERFKKTRQLVFIWVPNPCPCYAKS
jgi:hypothetical protein